MKAKNQRQKGLGEPGSSLGLCNLSLHCRMWTAPGRQSSLGEAASVDHDQFPGGGRASVVGEQENEVLNSDGESQKFTLA